MYRHQLAQFRRELHAFAQGRVVQASEILHATARHKRFEPNYATFRERFEVFQIPRHQSAPEREIRQRLFPRHHQFGVKTRRVERWRGRIQRHVEKHRAPARRQRLRTGFYPLPIVRGPDH